MTRRTRTGVGCQSSVDSPRPSGRGAGSSTSRTRPSPRASCAHLYHNTSGRSAEKYREKAQPHAADPVITYVRPRGRSPCVAGGRESVRSSRQSPRSSFIPFAWTGSGPMSSAGFRPVWQPRLRCITSACGCLTTWAGRGWRSQTWWMGNLIRFHPKRFMSRQRLTPGAHRACVLRPASSWWSSRPSGSPGFCGSPGAEAPMGV